MSIQQDKISVAGKTMAFFDISKIQGVPLVDGITIKAFYGNQCSVSFLEFAPMTYLPEHHHANEQIGFVLEGELEYTIGAETKHCLAGTVFVIPPNTPHSAVVISRMPVKLIDVFAPPRDLDETADIYSLKRHEER
jgi:quercetin dioxygenase-like cupin family protein